MTNPLTITVYGLAESKSEMPTVVVFKNKTARLDWICRKRDDVFISEFDQEIDLTTIPAVAALIERNAVLEAFVAKVASFSIASDEDFITWDDQEDMDNYFDSLDGYITDARSLASAGTCVAFKPKYDGQDCPEGLSQYDDGGADEWEDDGLFNTVTAAQEALKQLG